MANTYVIHKDSAISERGKRSILTAYLVWVMRNVSTLCTTTERNAKIQINMSRMQHSGYNTKERIDVYRAARKKYNKMLRKDSKGVTPLYREKNWIRIERVNEKETKKNLGTKMGKKKEKQYFS